MKEMIKRDKKGFLLAEYTLKVVIAAISLLLLVYLLFALYSSFTDKQNFARAEATLNSLYEKMNNVKTYGKSSIPLLEPNGWKVISYIQNERPNSCTKNCICVCEDIGTGQWKKAWIWADNQLEKCNTKGVCKDSDYLINEFNIRLRDEVDVEFKEGGFLITAKNQTI